jgi:hypothetical protein
MPLSAPPPLEDEREPPIFNKGAHEPPPRIKGAHEPPPLKDEREPPIFNKGAHEPPPLKGALEPKEQGQTPSLCFLVFAIIY